MDAWEREAFLLEHGLDGDEQLGQWPPEGTFPEGEGGGGGGWTGQATGEIPPSEVPGAEVGWPSAVPIRPARWDEDSRSYQVDWGDTLSGLAATYLGSHLRWREIWQEQDTNYRMTHNPDQLVVGEWLRMPLDAYATLLAATGRSGDIPPGATPATPPPGGYPAPVGPAPAAAKKKKIWPWVVGAAGVGVLALLGISAAG